MAHNATGGVVPAEFTAHPTIAPHSTGPHALCAVMLCRDAVPRYPEVRYKRYLNNATADERRFTQIGSQHAKGHPMCIRSWRTSWLVISCESVRKRIAERGGLATESARKTGSFREGLRQLLVVSRGKVPARSAKPTASLPILYDLLSRDTSVNH